MSNEIAKKRDRSAEISPKLKAALELIVTEPINEPKTIEAKVEDDDAASE
jgi:hypothetical protein